jgi:hypothetical protein
VLAEPTGEFIAVHATPTYGGDVMRIIRRASGDVVASIPVRCEAPVEYSEVALDRCRSVSIGARVLQRLGFAPVAEAKRSGDPQTVLFDNLRISRWIQKYGGASDVTIELAPARVLATGPDVAVAPQGPHAPRVETCAASMPRQVTSDVARPRNGGSITMLALLALMLLADVFLWRLALVTLDLEQR